MISVAFDLDEASTTLTKCHDEAFVGLGAHRTEGVGAISAFAGAVGSGLVRSSSPRIGGNSFDT